MKDRPLDVPAALESSATNVGGLLVAFWTYDLVLPEIYQALLGLVSVGPNEVEGLRVVQWMAIGLSFLIVFILARIVLRIVIHVFVRGPLRFVGSILSPIAILITHAFKRLFDIMSR